MTFTPGEVPRFFQAIITQEKTIVTQENLSILSVDLSFSNALGDFHIQRSTNYFSGKFFGQNFAALRRMSFSNALRDFHIKVSMKFYIFGEVTFTPGKVCIFFLLFRSFLREKN